jgi:hypothetical protein
MWYDQTDIKEMEGKTFTRVYELDNDTLVFENEDYRYTFYHSQDCCEYVYIESIVGDLDDLVGSPLLLSEEVSSDEGPLNEYEESYTWTFYKFATIKGYVDVRWYGISNGYYSESVQLRRENA